MKVTADNIVKRLANIPLTPDVEDYYIVIRVVLKPAAQLVSASQNSSQVQLISPPGLPNAVSLTFPRNAFQVCTAQHITNTYVIFYYLLTIYTIING